MKTVTTLAELNDLAGSGQLIGLFNVPCDLYHKGPGLSSTGIKELLKSPAHYQAYLKREQKDTPALRFGKLVHTRILEPVAYYQTVAIEPEVDGRTKEGKAIRAAFAEESLGKEIITSDEADLLDEIATAVNKCKLARTVFSGGEAELSVYWIDKETGVLCKARADYLRGDVIADLKTTYSAKEDDFRKAIAMYGYHLSAAHYLDGFNTVTPVTNFAWVALEKSPPYCMGFYAAAEEDLATGRAECLKAYKLYAECQESGVWPGYAEKFISISLGGV